MAVWSRAVESWVGWRAQASRGCAPLMTHQQGVSSPLFTLAGSLFVGGGNPLKNVILPRQSSL